jgi:chemotaxis protein histidine kinase CheA
MTTKTSMTLTSMERNLLFGIATSLYNCLNGGDGTNPEIIDNAVWSDSSLLDFSGAAKSYSGVLNSLQKKGLVGVQEGTNEMFMGTNQDPSTCWITKLGFDVLNDKSTAVKQSKKSNPKKESAMTTKTAAVAAPVATEKHPLDRTVAEDKARKAAPKAAKVTTPKSPATKKETTVKTTAKKSTKPAAKKVESKKATKPAAKAERAEVISNESKIKVLVTENPKRGKNARRIFDLYAKSKTVGEWRKAMAKAELDMGYLHGDIRRGLISVK